jgi:hypothetical protein
MKNVLKYSRIILISFLTACGWTGDYEEELSGGFFYHDEGSENKDIISHYPNQKNIWSKVVDYAYDEDFILVVQKPLIKYHRNSIAFEIREKNPTFSENTLEDITNSEQIADSIIKNDPYYQDIFSRELNYWIISHKERNEKDYMPMSKIYGPYSKEEFLQKRKELRIPKGLQLKE